MLKPYIVRSAVAGICTLMLIVLVTVTELTEAQPVSPDLSQTWLSGGPRIVLDYAKNRYGAEIFSAASQGIVVAPAQVTQRLTGKLPDRGVAVGFLFTSGTYAPTGRYELLSAPVVN